MDQSAATRILRIIIVSGIIVLLRFLDTYLLSLPENAARFEIFIRQAEYIAIAFLLVEILKNIIILIYSFKKDHEYPQNIILGIKHFAIVINVILFISAILSFYNLSLKEVFTSISIAAAAFAILFKDYISNILNGMILTFSGKININDYVKIGQHKGKIVMITLTSVELLNDDEDLVYLPNNLVFTTDIVNYTKRIIKKTNIDFEIRTGEFENVNQLESQIILCLEKYISAEEKESCHLKVVDIKEEFYHLRMQFVMLLPDREQEKILRRKVLREVILIRNQAHTLSKR